MDPSANDETFIQFVQEKRDYALRIISGYLRPSPRTYQVVKNCISQCDKALKMSDSQSQRESRIECIVRYLEEIRENQAWDEKNTGLREKLQELKGVYIFRKYGDYLLHMITEFRRMLDGNPNKEEKWDEKLITTIWSEYIAVESAIKEWKEGDQSGVQPKRIRRVQFVSLATQLRWTVDEVVSVFKDYHDCNGIAHGAKLKGLIEAEDWITLYAQMSNDIREVKPNTEIHPVFKKYADGIFKALESLQSKYFVLSVHGDPVVDVVLQPAIAEKVAKKAEAANLRREEQRQKEKEREKVEEEDKMLMEQAIKKITQEFREGLLDDVTSKGWKKILDDKAAIKEKRSAHEKTTKQLMEEIKKRRPEQDEMDEQIQALRV